MNDFIISDEAAKVLKKALYRDYCEKYYVDGQLVDRRDDLSLDQENVYPAVSFTRFMSWLSGKGAEISVEFTGFGCHAQLYVCGSRWRDELFPFDSIEDGYNKAIVRLMDGVYLSNTPVWDRGERY